MNVRLRNVSICGAVLAAAGFAAVSQASNYSL